MRTVLIAAMLLVAACKQNKSKLDDMIAHPPTVSNGSGAAPEASNWVDIDSKDILNRSESAKEVWVKHILIAWKDLDKVYQGQMDKRAENRSNEDAAKLAKDLAAQLKANPAKIDELVKAN